MDILEIILVILTTMIVEMAVGIIILERYFIVKLK